METTIIIISFMSVQILHSQFFDDCFTPDMFTIMLLNILKACSESFFFLFKMDKSALVEPYFHFSFICLFVLNKKNKKKYNV